jgi:hypothetical protein
MSSVREFDEDGLRAKTELREDGEPCAGGKLFHHNIVGAALPRTIVVTLAAEPLLHTRAQQIRSPLCKSFILALRTQRR